MRGSRTAAPAAGDDGLEEWVELGAGEAPDKADKVPVSRPLLLLLLLVVDVLLLGLLRAGLGGFAAPLGVLTWL